MLVGALVPPAETGAEAFDNVVKEDSVSQKKIGLKMDDVLNESKEAPEVKFVFLFFYNILNASTGWYIVLTTLLLRCQLLVQIWKKIWEISMFIETPSLI